jgi:hypothetical protein
MVAQMQALMHATVMRGSGMLGMVLIMINMTAS